MLEINEPIIMEPSSFLQEFSNLMFQRNLMELEMNNTFNSIKAGDSIK